MNDIENGKKALQRMVDGIKDFYQEPTRWWSVSQWEHALKDAMDAWGNESKELAEDVCDIAAFVVDAYKTYVSNLSWVYCHGIAHAIAADIVYSRKNGEQSMLVERPF